ncbi:MAG: hypothetical protein ACOCV4_06315 [Myxococcota bacterium]
MKGPRALLVAAALLAGCGGGKGPAARLEPVFERPDAVAARERTPDLMAAAERARSDAREAAKRGDADAAEDHATRSRLLVSAAVAESKRLDLEQERLEAERRARELETRARRAERERRRMAAETRRLLAARVARTQAEKAFAHAEAVELRHERRRGGEAASRHGRAAEVLRARAELLLSAARALGLEDAEAEAVEARIEQSAEQRTAHAELQAADEAVRAAMGALGDARADRADHPSQAQIEGLWQMAAERGLQVVRTERGTVLRPSGARWSPVARKRLASLLEAHPHGPVRVEGRAPSTAGGAARRAQRGARVLVRALVGEGVPDGRLEAEVIEGDGPVQVVLLAYAPR